MSPTPLESQYVGIVQAATNLLRDKMVDTVVSQLKNAATVQSTTEFEDTLQAYKPVSQSEINKALRV
jgi:hypothetical protein